MHPILKSHRETGRFSHGYLLTGDFESLRLSARKTAAVILDCPEDSLDSHPDFLEQSYELFSLDDNRDLARKIASKPILALNRAFLLKISSIAYEASVTLSKIIENPAPTSYFFLMTSFSEDIPVVLRSKLVNISEGKDFKLSDERKNFWQKFLESGPIERLALSKNAAGDKKIALDFLNELEIILMEYLKKEKQSSLFFKKLISSLEELKSMRRFLFDRAPSPRMIIEHFALTLPQLK